MAPQREWFEKDYYSTLGVPEGADEKEITRAYRKLAKQYHPDKNKGDAEAEERFKEISAAYDVLGDAEKRKEYDEVRQMVASGVGPGGPGFGGGAGGFGFGGGGRRRLPERPVRRRRRRRSRRHPRRALRPLRGRPAVGGVGAASHAARAAATTSRPSCTSTSSTRCTASPRRSASRPTRCAPSATAAGAKPGTFPEICPDCSGSGSIAVDQGPFSFSQVCPTCGGSGSIVKDKCPKCKGRGVERRRREVKVRIPAGVADGQRIRVKERGGAGAFGGPPGDLFVRVHVRPDTDLRSRGPQPHADRCRSRSPRPRSARRCGSRRSPTRSR